MNDFLKVTHNSLNELLYIAVLKFCSQIPIGINHTDHIVTVTLMAPVVFRKYIFKCQSETLNLSHRSCLITCLSADRELSTQILMSTKDGGLCCRVHV